MKPVEDLVASFPTGDPAQRLAVLVGTMMRACLSDEALIRTAMKDFVGLDDDQEIIATLEWAAGALLRTALQDFGGSQ